MYVQRCIVEAGGKRPRCPLRRLANVPSESCFRTGQTGPTARWACFLEKVGDPSGEAVLRLGKRMSESFSANAMLPSTGVACAEYRDSNMERLKRPQPRSSNPPLKKMPPIGAPWWRSFPQTSSRCLRRDLYRSGA